MNEIERKFLISSLPDLPILKRYSSERYLLKAAEGTEERITHTGGKYFYERKEALSELERTRDKHEITEDEFNGLQEHAYGKLTRETLVVGEAPKVVIQVYDGEYAGLMRAEVEFSSQEEANDFKPFEWMDREITGSQIARDSTLARMTRNELLSSIQTT